MGIWFADNIFLVAVVLGMTMGAIFFVTGRLQRNAVRRLTTPTAQGPSSHLRIAERLTDSPGLNYRDAQTIRVASHERIDRLHKLVQLKIGHFEDVLESRPGLKPRLRLTARAVERIQLPNQAQGVHAEVDAARILIEIGEAQAGGGAWVTQTAPNEFLLPVMKDEEHRCSIFHFSSHGDALSFVRVCLIAINKETQTVQLDVLQVCGQWLS
jgi:hypothetical protein